MLGRATGVCRWMMFSIFTALSILTAGTASGRSCVLLPDGGNNHYVWVERTGGGSTKVCVETDRNSGG